MFAAGLRLAAVQQREALVELAAVVRQMDGRHLDRGATTVAVRAAARKAGAAAEETVRSLSALESALKELAAAAGEA